jgi:O-antigen ligase
MIQVIVAILFIIFAIIGLAYLVVYKAYTFRDLLVLLLFLYPVLFLGRFSVALRYNFLGQWYLGFELSMVGFLVVFLLMKFLNSDSGKMRLFWPISLAVLLFAIGLFSGLINGTGIRDYGAAMQAGFRWFIPFLAACAAISVLPKTSQSNARLVSSYILVYGILSPLLRSVSSLFTTQVGRLMGWEPFGISEAAGAGFTRGWTPTGSTISSGMLVVFAYAMALTRLIRKEHVGFNAFVAILCVIAVFFTLARSVMLVLVLFHLLMFKDVLWRNFSRVVVSLLVIVILLVPSLIVLGHWYSFERFVAGGGESTRLRWSSLKAGLVLASEKPVLGQGPGLLYWEVRQPWGMPGTHPEERTTTFRNLPSAKEPHNLYVLAFAETGLVGLALLGAVLLYCLHRLKVAKIYSNVYVPEWGLDASAHWSMLISFLVFCLTSASVFIYPKVSLTMWAALLVGLHSAATVENEALVLAESSEQLESDYSVGQATGVESYDEQLVRETY